MPPGRNDRRTALPGRFSLPLVCCESRLHSADSGKTALTEEHGPKAAPIDGNATMIRWMILRRIDFEERRLGVAGCLDYVRQLFRVSPGAFCRFAPLGPAAAFHRALPATAHALAHVVVAVEADCGTCVQIAVHAARKAGVEPDGIQAALAGNFDPLPADLAMVCRFAQAVIGVTGEAELLRHDIRLRYGDAGLAELSMTIALAGAFPVMKRGMGYSAGCQAVKLDL